MTAAAATLCLALQAAYDRAAVAYLARAAATGAPEIALAIDLSEMPHITAERLRAVEAAMKQKGCIE